MMSLSYCLSFTAHAYTYIPNCQSIPMGWCWSHSYVYIHSMIDRPHTQVEERIRTALTTAAASGEGGLAWVKRVEIEVYTGLCIMCNIRPCMRERRLQHTNTIMTIHTYYTPR